MKERHIITGGRALSEVQEHFRQAVEGLSYRTLQDQALNAEAAAIEGVRRVTAGDNREWEITIAPSGAADVPVTLSRGPACGEPHAICTEDGRQLANEATATVPGP